jgi:hypothetical protein
MQIEKVSVSRYAFEFESDGSTTERNFCSACVASFDFSHYPSEVTGIRWQRLGSSAMCEDCGAWDGDTEEIF